LPISYRELKELPPEADRKYSCNPQLARFYSTQHFGAMTANRLSEENGIYQTSSSWRRDVLGT
jgi:hypothetical protein